MNCTGDWEEFPSFQVETLIGNEMVTGFSGKDDHYVAKRKNKSDDQENKR